MAKKSYCNCIDYPDEPRFQPSLVSECLFTDANGVKKFHSDIHLILRDKSFANNIGPDAFRQYVQSIMDKTGRDSSGLKDLDDDQLMESILDRRLSDATDVYQFTDRLESYIDEYKDKLDKYHSAKKKLSDLKSSLDKK